MQRDIVLAVHTDGEAVRVFYPGEKYLAATLAGVIAREAERLMLDVSVVVVPMHEPTAEEIAAFFKECWEEPNKEPVEAVYTPPVLFPPNAYSN